MQADIHWLTDPTVFQVNRLDAHSDHIGYASAAEADSGVTSLRQPLDGLWRFAWSKAPSLRPAAFWQEDFDSSGFGLIEVPGHTGRFNISTPSIPGTVTRTSVRLRSIGTTTL